MLGGLNMAGSHSFAGTREKGHRVPTADWWNETLGRMAPSYILEEFCGRPPEKGVYAKASQLPSRLQNTAFPVTNLHIPVTLSANRPPSLIRKRPDMPCRYGHPPIDVCSITERWFLQMSKPVITRLKLSGQVADTPTVRRNGKLPRKGFHGMK
jgi:hypothetical protein